MGTTKIFETAVEEFFVHENTLKELPKQKPNCIFGFKNTEYIRQFLEQSNSEIMQSFIRTSPLKHGSPIFPFLALEAKSDSSSASFSDIQTQTALPLWALLNLQNDLNSRIVEAQGLPKPLAWFLGYRGSDWKVYGCYLGSDLESNITYVGYFVSQVYPIPKKGIIGTNTTIVEYPSPCEWRLRYHRRCYPLDFNHRLYCRLGARHSSRLNCWPAEVSENRHTL